MKPWNIAHRGGAGLWPENTLVAFRDAVARGCDGAELDVQLSRDGEVIVFHDYRLKPEICRGTDGRFLEKPTPRIKDLSLEGLKTCDVGRANPASAYARSHPVMTARDGERIPTLAALFARVRELGANDIEFDIETKIFPDRPDDTVPPEEFVAKLLAVIRSAGMNERVMIQSFNWRTLAIVQRVEPGMRTVYLTTQGRGGGNVADPRWVGGLKLADYPSVAHMVKAAGGRTWAPNFNNVDEARCAAPMRSASASSRGPSTRR